MKLSNTLFQTKIPHKKLLIVFLGLGLLLRVLWLFSWNTFFSDQEWFYRQASNALMNGTFPILGITTSITWLHQGPLWTYLLIPPLAISGFHPLSGSILTIFFSLMTVLFTYRVGTAYLGKNVGVLSAFIYAFSCFSVVHSRISYHTSPIPLFLSISIYLLYKRSWFMTGLFLGFLYQLHLLTFIFWPLALYLTYKQSGNPFLVLFGALVGITPLIIAGPVQMVGIFAWMLKFVAGMSTSSGISVSYQVVFLLPFTVASAFIISKLNRKLQFIFCIVFLLINMYRLLSSEYMTASPNYQPTLADQINKAKNCELSADSFISWWLSKNRKIGCYN